MRIFKTMIGILLFSMILCSCGKEVSTNQNTKDENISVLEEAGETIENLAEGTEEQEPSWNVIGFALNSLPVVSPKATIDTEALKINQKLAGYAYERLTKKQKALFAFVIQKRKLLDGSIVQFAHANKDDVERVVQAVILENSYQYINIFYLSEKEESVYVGLLWQTQVTKKQKKKTEKAVKKILREIDGESSQEIIRQIYDWCTTNIDYDLDAPHARDLYGALVEKRCVCVGYAKAFRYLCSLKGIEVICVPSKVHMWNYVQLAGEWYAVDATNGKPGTTKYLLSGKEILSKESCVPDEKNFSFPILEKENYDW